LDLVGLGHHDLVGDCGLVEHIKHFIVDMQGYGYAQAPKEQVDKWTKIVFDYLRGRATLKRVYVLIESRHGIKKKDDEV
ncbi:hypothetical protein ACC695_40460, partial [Rhizobium ruizarguesonis]